MCYKAGIRSVSVFLNKADLADAELLEPVEMNIRDALSEVEFPGDDIAVVIGSASTALKGDDIHDTGFTAVKKLMGTLSN